MVIDNEFTKANIKRSTKKILNKIVAEEDKFEYEVLEELLKDKYPSYFRKHEQKPIKA